MDETKKKKPEDESVQEEKPKDNGTPAEENKPEDKPQEKSPEDNPSEEKAEEKSEETQEKPPTEEKEDTPSPEVPQLSETDKLKAENLTLKTQIEAFKIGFNPDCLDDAVVLAENIVKRDGSDISTALQAVAKKYPDWKSGGKDSKDNKSKGGFKVGVDSSDNSEKGDSDKLSQAFGIKKKKC